MTKLSNFHKAQNRWDKAIAKAGRELEEEKAAMKDSKRKNKK